MKTYIKYIIAFVLGLIKPEYEAGEYVVSFADDECILLTAPVVNEVTRKISYKQIWSKNGSRLYDDFNGGSFVRLTPLGKTKTPKFYNSYRLATKKEIKKLK